MMNQATPPQNVIDCLQTILDAVVSGNYELFTTVGNSSYKAGITRQMFEGVSKQLSSRMGKGDATTYFGHLKQLHYQIYLWKLSFEDVMGRLTGHFIISLYKIFFEILHVLRSNGRNNKYSKLVCLTKWHLH